MVRAPSASTSAWEPNVVDLELRKAFRVVGIDKVPTIARDFGDLLVVCNDSANVLVREIDGRVGFRKHRITGLRCVLFPHVLRAVRFMKGAAKNQERSILGCEELKRSVEASELTVDEVGFALPAVGPALNRQVNHSGYSTTAKKRRQ